MYQLSTCWKWYVHHSKHSMIILVTKPVSITPVLSLARKASERILPVKTITQGKSKPLVENIFSYQSSYWGMSTLAVPVLLIWFCTCVSEKVDLVNLPTTCWPQVWFYWPLTDHFPFVTDHLYSPHTNCLYRPHVLTTYQPRTDHILTRSTCSLLPCTCIKIHT